MNRKKKVLTLICMIFIMISTTYIYSENDISIKIQNKLVEEKGIICEGRTLVPVRVISESLGALVEWKGETKEVEVKYKLNNDTNGIMIFKIGNKDVELWKNDFEESKRLEVPAQIINGNTMIPLRFIAEEMNLKVQWNEQSRTVELIDQNEIYDGKLYYPNGMLKYEGQIKRNHPKGDGVYYYQNGDVYKGHFFNNKKNGYGEIRYACGDLYAGNFKNDEKNEYGKYIWMNGEYYEGQWKDDMMHGNGTYVFENGDMYTGEWRNNYMNGSGSYTKHNGIVISGTWEKNIYQY